MTDEDTHVYLAERQGEAHQLLQLRQVGYHVGPVALPLCAGIAQQVQLPEVNVACQAEHAAEAALWHKVCCEIQPFQGLAALHILDALYVVECDIKVS